MGERIILNQKRKVSLKAFTVDHSKFNAGVLILPGGGYSFCSKRESDVIAERFANSGYSAFVLHYSVGDYDNLKHALEDITGAFKLLNQRQEKWGIDIRRIIVIGFSAGGHLGAVYANISPEFPPILQVLGYPCILDSMNELLGIKGKSVSELVTEKTCPAFIFSTFEDELVPVENSIAYQTALNQYQVPFESHIFQFGSHGLSLGTAASADGDKKQIDSHYAHWFELCIEWIENNLR